MTNLNVHHDIRDAATWSVAWAMSDAGVYTLISEALKFDSHFEYDSEHDSWSSVPDHSNLDRYLAQVGAG